MGIPEDPIMLMSYVNMKLRDGEYADLAELCDSMGCNEHELMEKLKSAGFDYIESQKQFR